MRSVCFVSGVRDLRAGGGKARRCAGRDQQWGASSPAVGRAALRAPRSSAGTRRSRPRGWLGLRAGAAPAPGLSEQAACWLRLRTPAALPARAASRERAPVQSSDVSPWHPLSREPAPLGRAPGGPSAPAGSGAFCSPTGDGSAASASARLARVPHAALGSAPAALLLRCRSRPRCVLAPREESEGGFRPARARALLLAAW